MARNSAGSSSQSHFSKIPSAEIQRSVFDRSFGHKTTFNEGRLIPIFVDEVLPGDTFRLKTSHLTRLATPIFPYMDNVFIDFHFFFVPNRLVWTNWERMNGAQDDPGDSTDFLVPTITSPAVTGFAEGSAMDYFGIPTKVPGLVVQALPFRAMQLIWNEWYRDENLQDSLVVPKGDGPDDANAAALIYHRGKRKDYFTSALPWPQKGPSVMVPLGGSAPVYSPELFSEVGGNQWQSFTNTGPTRRVGQISVQAGSPGFLVSDMSTGSVLGSVSLGTKEDYDSHGQPPFADLAEATAATINQLREAFQLQRLFERDARGGTRYTEILLSHFGVRSPDFRLQRPEYLGGGSSVINVNPIAQTSQTVKQGDDPSAQGNLAAFAVSSKSGIGFNHSFVEHGHVLGFMSVRADMTYQQGLNKMWSRQTRYDFYWPVLSHLGEQPILNREIFAVGSGGATDDQVFGYQERYAEYRYRPSVVTGKMRSNATGSLDAWHLAYDFDVLPVLNETFIHEAPPIERIVAVPSEPHFICDLHFDLKCTRPMPTYSVPGLIDHF